MREIDVKDVPDNKGICQCGNQYNAGTFLVTIHAAKFTMCHKCLAKLGVKIIKALK